MPLEFKPHLSGRRIGKNLVRQGMGKILDIRDDQVALLETLGNDQSAGGSCGSNRFPNRKVHLQWANDPGGACTGDHLAIYGLRMEETGRQGNQ